MIHPKDDPHLEKRKCKICKKVFYVTKKGIIRRHRKPNPLIRQNNSVTCSIKCSKRYLYGDRVYNDLVERRDSLIWK